MNKTTSLNLEYYKVFYNVAKAGRITLAAEKLSLSQPAVSHSIQQLETFFGLKLFVRTAKGVKLTTDGEILFQYVERGYEQIALGEQKLVQRMNLDVGELRIGASDMTLQFYLLPYLERFHELYPKVKVRVTNGPTPQTLLLLKEGKIDFGIVSTPFEEKKGIQMVPVREVEDVFVAGRRFMQYKNKTLDFAQLKQCPLICLEKETSTRTHMDRFLLENKVVILPEFELATSDMIVQFALRNLGIGVVVKEFAKEYLESGKLFALRFNKHIPKRQFCIVTDEKQVMSVGAKKLLELMQEE